MTTMVNTMFNQSNCCTYSAVAGTSARIAIIIMDTVLLAVSILLIRIHLIETIIQHTAYFVTKAVVQSITAFYIIFLIAKEKVK